MKEQGELQNLTSETFETNVAASPRFRNSRTPLSLHDLGMTTHSGIHPQEPIQRSCFCLCFDFTLDRDQCAEAVQNCGSHPRSTQPGLSVISLMLPAAQGSIAENRSSCDDGRMLLKLHNQTASKERHMGSR